VVLWRPTIIHKEAALHEDDPGDAPKIRMNKLELFQSSAFEVGLDPCCDPPRISQSVEDVLIVWRW